MEKPSITQIEWAITLLENLKNLMTQEETVEAFDVAISCMEMARGDRK